MATDHDPDRHTTAFARNIATGLARVSLALALLLLVAACDQGPNVAPTAEIEFRAAQRTPFPDSLEREWPVGEPIYLEPTASIVATDLHRVRPTLGESDQPVLSVQLTPEGAAKMEELSKRQAGKLAAVLIQDEIVTVATMRGQISDALLLDGAWTGEELQEIVATLRVDSR